MKKAIISAAIAASVAWWLQSCQQPGVGTGEQHMQEITQQEHVWFSNALQRFMSEYGNRFKQWPIILEQTSEYITIFSSAYSPYNGKEITRIDSWWNILLSYKIDGPYILHIWSNWKREESKNIPTETVAEWYRTITQLLNEYGTKQL